MNPGQENEESSIYVNKFIVNPNKPVDWKPEYITTSSKCSRHVLEMRSECIKKSRNIEI